MSDLSLRLINLPSVNHLTSDGSSYVLGTSAAGFSNDGTLELIEVNVRDIGYGYSGIRKGYFVYDVGADKYYEWDFAKELADSLGLKSSDISLYDASITGTKTSFSVVVSYKTEGGSATDARKIALFEGKQVVSPDILEQISGEAANAGINKLKIENDYIFFSTAAFNINTNPELDANEVIDVYRLSIIEETIERVSTVDGLELTGHSGIEDTLLTQEWVGVLFSSQSAFSDSDTNDAKDVAFHRFAIGDNEENLNLLSNEDDGNFLNRGIESADWFFDKNILVSSRSDFENLYSYGDAVKLILWDFELGALKNLDTGLENFEILASSVTSRNVLVVGEDPEKQLGPQAYLLRYDDNYNLTEKLQVSVYESKNVTDQILGGTISENGSVISLDISDVNWDVSDYLPLGRTYVVNFNSPPVFSSSSAGTVSENSVTSTVIYDGAASDQDAGDTLTYSVSGTDADLVEIDSDDGEVRLKVSANYESKSSYSFVVSATDSVGAITDQSVTVSVTDVNEAPSVTSGASASIQEHAVSSTVVYTVSSSDPDTDASASYSLSGTDADYFEVDTTSGAVTLKASADYETQDSYAITVEVSDGTLTASQAVTVSVTDVNEAPSVTSGASANIQENAVSSTVVYTVSSSDPDTDASASYSLSGTDADYFEVDATSGAVTLKASADYETQDSYAITVEVSDGTLTASQAVNVRVTDINDAPVFSSGATGSVSENSATSTVIYDGTATDQDAGDTLTYSVSGTDADLVEIDSDDGEVRLKASANYESKASYGFVVSATDSVGAITDQSVTVSVTDVNDPVVGDLSLIGEPLVDEYLEVSASSLSDEDGTQSIEYVWYRGTEIIEGASESRYLVTSADVDSILSVDVIHTDEAGNEDALKIASLLPAYEGLKTYGTESSDKLYSTSENEIFYGLGGEDQFIFDKATQVHGSDKIVDFTKGEDEVILNGFQIGEVVRTLDENGYDVLTFPNQDEGKNQLVIENVATQNETLKIDHSNVTINFNQDVSVASNEDGDIAIDTSTSFNAVSLEGVTSFKTQIRSEGQSRASDPINLSDVLSQLKHIIGLKELTLNAKYAADTNNDGHVNLSDVLENLKHIIGLKTIDTFDLVSENGQQLNMLDENSRGNMTLVINGDADQSHAEWDAFL